MEIEKFYPAKERKNDFLVKDVYYTQMGLTTHTIRKTVTKGRIVIGMKTWEVKNDSYKTEEEFNNAICKCKSDRNKTETRSCWVYK